MTSNGCSNNGSNHGTGFCRAHPAGKAYRLDDRALYLVGIRPEDAAKACARNMPEGPKGECGGDAFTEKPRAGAYRRYIILKDIVHEES